MISKGAILTALRDCYDPEVKLNLIDMGLVYGIATGQDLDSNSAPPRQWVKVKMTLTHAMGPTNVAIVEQVHHRLASLEDVSRVEIELVWDPKWSNHRISPAGRKQLGM